MWWGGEGEGNDPGTPRNPKGDSESDEGDVTPPIDLTEEAAEAKRAVEAAEDEDEVTKMPEDEDSGSGDDIEDLPDLKEQFTAQEKLLGQLKGVLKSNEEKLHSKEKVVQVRQLT